MEGHHANEPEQHANEPELNEPEQHGKDEEEEESDGDYLEEESVDISVDIDKCLANKASFNNLSVQNVKSIIHHVLKDERVLKMAQQLAEKGNANDEVIFEPKLTRSRVRQAVGTSSNYSPSRASIVSATPSPNKIRGLPVCTMPHALLGLQFPEEISDEEYDPENTKDTDDLESDTLEDDEVHDGNCTENDSDTDMNSNVSTPKPSEQSSATPSSHHGGMDEITPTKSDADGEQLLKTPVNEMKDNIPVCVTTPSSLPVHVTTPYSLPVCVTTPSSLPSSTVIQSSISEDDLVKETAVLLASLSDTILTPIKSSDPILPPSSSGPILPPSSSDPILPPSSSGPILPPSSSGPILPPSSSGPILPPSSSDPILPPSSSDRILPPSSPNESTLVTDNNETENGEIAHRTRSKLPLVDKDIDEIEATFVPPDLPPDDSNINTPSTCMDFDEDELHWQEWLSDLMNLPDTESHSQEVEDQDDDTDYNFYADHHEDEGEEFRTDRGVKIPQKEADELIEEILNPNSGFFNTDFTCLDIDTDEGRDFEEMGVTTMTGQSIMDPTSAYLLESLGLHLPTNPTPKKQIGVNYDGRGRANEDNTAQEKNNDGSLSDNQIARLWDQIQQHFQLLLQTFILTRHEPSLVFLSQIATQALEEIINLCYAARQGNGRSIWFLPGVDEGKELITKYNPHNPDSVELVQAVGQPPKIPIQVQEIIMEYGVFWQYPNLIPEIGPYALDHPTPSKYFLPSEDGLLALGMDHYGSSAWKLIQQNLLPVKAPRQLNLRVKNLNSARQKTDNVVKHFKRTGNVLLPFTKDKDDDVEGDLTECNSSGLKLPQWVLMYHRKRIEKEKTEEKRRERELEAMVKLVKTVTTVNNDNHSVVAAGSKRSLSEQFNAVDSTAKRSKKMSNKDVTSPTNNVQTKKKKIKKSPIEGDSDEYNQLLYLAGLEANDPAARFAYKYLTEVKATVMDSPGVYDKFLRLITKARKRNWRPVKLYIHVCDTLRPWPHLLKLFMGFVGPLDAIEANMLKEKMEFEQIKSFVNTLESKYSNSPLQLQEIVTTMKELSNEERLTQQKVFSSLCPLIEAHEDLIQDLNSFIHGLKIPGDIALKERMDNDDFEEINTIGKRNITDIDDFEEMTVTDDWTPSYEDNTESSIQNCNGDQHQHKHNTSNTSNTSNNNKTIVYTNIEEDSNTVTITGTTTTNKSTINNTIDDIYNTDPNDSPNHSPIPVDSLPDYTSHSVVLSTDTTASITVPQTVTANCTLIHNDDNNKMEAVTEQTIQWTRDDDRYLLQVCLQGDPTRNSTDTLAVIANHLNRSLDEVRLRCSELLTMMKSMTSS